MMKKSEGEKGKWWNNEDWIAVLIGAFIILIASISVVSGSFDFKVAKFSTWATLEDLIDTLSVDFLFLLLKSFLIIGIVFTAGNAILGKDIRKYIPGYAILFGMAVLVRVISAQFVCNRYLEWAFFALLIGLIISNTIGTGNVLRTAVQTEFYIKTGLVIMGFSVLFSNIVNFGLYGIGIAWFVTPLVIIFMWYFGVHVLKIDNKPMVITMAAATSVCGTSAAIATGAAAKAKKNDLSMVVSISIMFTILMMVIEPVIIKFLGIGELMGGALIGGTIDSTGAVAVAGTALGNLAQTTAILVKSIQNILIGFIAFFVAVFFAKNERDGKTSVTAKEIWIRLPKFILGFFAASLFASLIGIPMWGIDKINEINSVLDQYKNWAFIMAFLSIGLDTNFKELKEQLSGGKTLILYVVGQLFNVVLTFCIIYLLLSGKFLPLPSIAR